MDWLGLLILLGAGLALALAAAAAHTAWTLTHPPRRGYAFALARSLPSTPEELSPALGGSRRFRTWTHRAGAVSLEVWEIDGDAPSGPAIIFSHGWGESRILALLRVAPLAPHASRIILYDLRGHGESSGLCILGLAEEGDLRSLIHAVAGASPSEQGAPAPVVLMGFSLGAGVSIAAAVDNPLVRGVVAEAPYLAPSTPARNVLIQSGLPHRVNLPIALGMIAGLAAGWREGLAWLGASPSPGFDRAALARRLRVPLLVLRGDLDAIVPDADVQAIASAAADGRLTTLPGAGHVDLWIDARSRALATDQVRLFLEKLGPSPARRPERVRTSSSPTRTGGS